MYRVDATPNAERALRVVPGLYRRAEEMLVGILESAEQVREALGDTLDLDSWLRLRIRSYVISYTLDLDNRRALILSVESLGRGEGEGSSSAR